MRLQLMRKNLTALDQAIGDGDHGLNMKRGFEAVRAEADAFAAKPLPEALKAIGTKLVMTVGGASGPLFGTLFMALGKELPPSRIAPIWPRPSARPSRRWPRGASRRSGKRRMLDVLLSGACGAVAQGKPACEIADAADRGRRRHQCR